MTCFKSILFFSLVVLCYLASATAQVVQDAPSTAAANQKVDTTRTTNPEDEAEEEEENNADVLWVKNLIGVQISDLSDNCFELAARRCAKFAGNNDKTLNCAVSYKNSEDC